MRFSTKIPSDPTDVSVPMAKPFWLIYLVKGAGVVGSLLKLNHCLSDLLFNVDLQTHCNSARMKHKLINICEMHRTEVLKLWCHGVFNDFQ